MFNLLVAPNYPVVEVLLPSGVEIQQCTADTCVKVGIGKMMRPNKNIKSPVFTVTLPYLNLLVKPRNFLPVFWKMYNLMHFERQIIKK